MEPMADLLDVYIFRDPSFAPDGNTLVCVAPRRAMKRFMSKRECRAHLVGAPSIVARCGLLMSECGATETARVFAASFVNAVRN